MNILENYLNKIQTNESIDVGGSIGYTILLNLILKNLRKYKERNKTEAGNHCKKKLKLKGKDLDTCILKYKIKTYENHRKYLKQQISKCSKTSNPSKCKSALNNTINQVQKNIYTLKGQL